MTREEFLIRLPDCTRKPTEGEFRTIQFVYTYHPIFNCANAKDKIANLYFEYGMRIICDMMDTARRAQKIEDEQRSLRLRLDKLKREAAELAMAKDMEENKDNG